MSHTKQLDKNTLRRYAVALGAFVAAALLGTLVGRFAAMVLS